MYRRNRYYDPGTGRLTQEDPIGLAGGVNVYGFANGDPVNYSDPYGLCAKELYNKETKTCPGGLSIFEYRHIESGIRENLRDRRAGRLQERLETGRIRKVGADVTSEPAIPDFATDAVLVTDKLFQWSPAESVWILAHETGHIIQWQSGMFVHEIGRRGSRSNQHRMSRYMNADRNSAEHNFLQADANWYACTITKSAGAWGVWC